MSNNNNDLPSFSGAPDFSNGISLIDEDEYGEETTRRVGAAPSFGLTFDTQMSAGPVNQAFIGAAPQKATFAPTPKNLWKVNDCQPLPDYHPLERTATFCPYMPVGVVAERISATLEECSIEAIFDDAKAKATCKTIDNVDFCIFLYRGKGKYRHGIIVEVQRRSGHSWNFERDVQCILDAAEGKQATPSMAPLPPPIEDDSENDVSLTFVHTMMQANETLALNTLESMTDASKIGEHVARSACRQLLSDKVGSRVLQLVSEGNRLALKILYNVVQNVPLGGLTALVRDSLLRLDESPIVTKILASMQ